MQKTIFVLRGKSNVGKTTTIKILYELLEKQYPQSTRNELILKKDHDGKIIEDIKVIITINEIKIGIESQGDLGSRLPKSLKDFVENECEIIVCGARTWGKTNDVINEYSKQFKIIWIRKEITMDTIYEETCNKQQALEVIKKIDYELENI
jgi:energy-coupling factor transporter ATP-binding protein EcfA2